MARPALVRAAAADRRLARTAIHIPMIPARPLQKAPKTKATAVCHAVSRSPAIT